MLVELEPNLLTHAGHVHETMLRLYYRSLLGWPQPGMPCAADLVAYSSFRQGTLTQLVLVIKFPRTMDHTGHTHTGQVHETMLRLYYRSLSGWP